MNIVLPRSLLLLLALYQFVDLNAIAGTPIPNGPGININRVLYGHEIHLEPELLIKTLHSVGFVWGRLPIDVSEAIERPSNTDDQIINRLYSVLQSAKKEAFPLLIAPTYQPHTLAHDSNVATLADPSVLSRYVAFLNKIANVMDHYADLTALELMNEPDDCRTTRWEGEEATIYTQMRANHRNLGLVLTSDCWSTWQSLSRTDPARYSSDPMLGYTFHFYEPYVFTAQNVPWAQDYPRFTGAIPFPPDADRLADAKQKTLTEIAATTADKKENAQRAVENFTKAIEEYQNKAWPLQIYHDFWAVRDWAVRWHLNPSSIIVGEFGVMRSEPSMMRADQNSRRAWIANTAQAAKTAGFSWAYWSLYGPFGIADDEVPLKIDKEVADAVTRPPP